jgi:hypothetical protein
MRFFRGLAVPADKANATINAIRRDGLNTRPGRWFMEHRHPGSIEDLFAKPNLSLDDTRPENAAWLPAICVCGDEDGAAYYAWRHNRHADDDTPVMIEFEANGSHVAVDGRDCLYTVFQMGDSGQARDFLRNAFGERVLRYAEKAWAAAETGQKIALCDLAIHDPEVIEAHYANQIAIGGRHKTIFRSAFTVALPVAPAQIVRIWLPAEEPVILDPHVHLGDLTLRR